MNNILRFTKYVENELSVLEKQKFERELSENENIRKEFNKFLSKYKSLNPDLNFDESYFITLLPRVRERISEQENSFFNFSKIPNAAYLIPIFLISFLLIFKVINNQNSANKEINFSNFISDFTENNEIANELLKESIQLNNNVNYESNIYSVLYDESDYEKIIINYLEENNHIFELNESVVNQLSENEFNLVYNELINKKIL
ncbi:MAG: hypothetical protein IPH62_01425 [Ignavibacteriae bacterium]|nr:hypothetical protein [Ignavibacteriota bacterium]